MIITSPANPTIKHIRKLHDRKYRDIHQQFLVEGLRLTAEAIEEGVDLEYLVVSEELLTSQFGKSLVQKYQGRGGQVILISADLFKRISQKDGPQGIAAVGTQRRHDLTQIQPGSAALWVGLDRIQDPGNLGTLLRTGDAVGSSGAILIGHCTDPYDPAALRASMGATFSQKLVKASLEEIFTWKSRHKIPFVGTSDKAKTHYRDFTFPERLVVLLGSEREGLDPQLLTLCDDVVRIPMAGKSDSLNLSVAAGVILYEYFEQQRQHGGIKGEK